MSRGLHSRNRPFHRRVPRVPAVGAEVTTFVLVPGAGGSAWYWHRLVAELEGRGHDAVAVDLPAEDDSVGLAAYAD